MEKCRIPKFKSAVLILIFSVYSYARETASDTDHASETSRFEEIVKDLEVKATASAEYHKELEDVNEYRHSELGRFIRAYIENNRPEKTLKQKLQREAFERYKAAADVAIESNKIKYTREISTLAVELKSEELLSSSMTKLIASTSDEKGRYLACIDYAVGLSEFKNPAAKTYFQKAVDMRNPADGVEAYYRYAQYLVGQGQPDAALEILNRFSERERDLYLQVVSLRQKIMDSMYPPHRKK